MRSSVVLALLTLMVFVALGARGASAQEAPGPRAGNPPPRPGAQIRVERKELIDTRRADMEKAQDVRAGIRAEVKNFNIEVKGEVKSMRADTRAELEAASTSAERRAILDAARG